MLEGEAGADFLAAGPGADTLDGGEGDDTLSAFISPTTSGSRSWRMFTPRSLRSRIGPGGCQALPVALSNAAADAVALVTAPANWPAAIQVTALLGPGDRSVSVLACNFTGAPADPGPVSFRYLVIEF